MRTTLSADAHGRTDVAVGLCVVVLLILTFAVPAHASPTTRSAKPRPTAQDNHTAGSQIAKREGKVSMAPRASKTRARNEVHGMDVSSHQGDVDWASASESGAQFAYVKATESTTYTNPYFSQQFNGTADTGMIRGAYHFALPDRSDGASQANYFVDNGGGWAADGMTLPPALDMEYNPYGDTCYGLSQADMVQWVKDFSDTVHAKAGRWPTIYTSTSWWSWCTGNLGDFSSTIPLWVARYASTVGPLPYAWSQHTIWQYASSGTFPGDQNLFNGTYEQLQTFARSAA
jgi:GH25 family lysozyme M1 (1,4-beta-N-acetylmuramidase)